MTYSRKEIEGDAHISENEGSKRSPDLKMAHFKRRFTMNWPYQCDCTNEECRLNYNGECHDFNFPKCKPEV